MFICLSFFRKRYLFWHVILSCNHTSFIMLLQRIHSLFKQNQMNFPIRLQQTARFNRSLSLRKSIEVIYVHSHHRSCATLFWSTSKMPTVQNRSKKT